MSYFDVFPKIFLGFGHNDKKKLNPSKSVTLLKLAAVCDVLYILLYVLTSYRSQHSLL